ncbi:asparagine synthase (glutamine-hydrolyzing) [Myxococcota bacterium]|nr:asparagine synthase (glutamine-hydrolyzing) [Myxococcota bacterium]
MCGIVGIYERRDRSPDQRVLDAMTDRLVHRGPDGRGTYVHEGVGLGHRRLAIIGLGDGAQPMSNEDGTVWVTYNGEIYNYLELKRDLQALGHELRTSSDTEVLVHGFESWGLELVHRLRGIYAFAIHDQATRRLFLVRDRLGVKPLYYHLTPERFVFASEPKALLVHPDVAKRPDLDALQLYLRYGYVPGGRSAFEGLRQLEPGCLMFVGEDRVVEARYWEPPPVGLGGDRAEDVELELDRRVDDAVGSELMSEVPLGAFLSGGVDSSVVAASMARSARLGARPRTFCIGFDEERFDESPHAERVARHLGLDHQVERLRRQELALLDTLVDVYDEPFADSSAMPTFALCKMARRHVTVALSGDGGDEVFAGYRRYQKLARFGALPAPVRRAAGEAARVYPPSLRGSGTLRALGLPAAEHYRAELTFPEHVLREVASPELMSRPAVWSIESVFERAPAEDPVQKAQWADLVTYLPGDILVKVDRASMAHGLEVRVPLLDHVFVEWALALPRAQTFGDGQGKVALKAHLARRVPRALFERPKMGFGVPLEYWLGGEGGLVQLADRLRARHPSRRFFAPIDGGAFDRIARGTGRNEQTQLVWSLLFLEAWWQRHFVRGPR